MMNELQKPLTIWYCHPYACPPGVGRNIPNRPYLLAALWQKMGHKVQVITASYEHIAGNKSDQLEDYKSQHMSDVDFIWLKIKPYEKSAVSRVKSMLAYTRLLKRYGKEFAERYGKPDIIICSSPDPFHFDTCLRLSKQLNAKVISEIRDLWPLSLQEILGLNPWHPLCLWLANIQRRMCRHSDVVVALSRYANRYLSTKGLSEEKFNWIPNGFLLQEPLAADLLQQDEIYQQIIKSKQRGNFIIGYTGALGLPNNMGVLCEAVASLAHDNVELYLIGEGNHKQALYDKYNEFKHIHFIPPQSKVLALAYQKIFDVGYLGWRASRLYDYGMSPNKLFEYMQNVLPVLCPAHPKTTPVHDAGCGVLFEKNEAASLRQTILQAKTLTPEQLRQIGLKGRKAVEEHYLYPDLANKYLALMSELIQ